MKIGIISDTHDQLSRVQKAVKIFNDEGVEFVIHCGDIVAPFTLKYYTELKCPIRFLYGNNSGDIMRYWENAKKFGFDDHDFANFFSLELAGKRIAVYHGEYAEITEALIKCGDYDCVFAGHDHAARIENRGKVLFVNPGALVDKHKEGMGDPSIAIYDTQTNEARLIKIN